MSNCMYTFIVKADETGVRLLRFLQDKIDRNRKDIRFSIEHQGCLVNNRLERFASRKLTSFDKIQFKFIEPPSLDIRVLFEDTYFIAYDKPAHISTESLQQEVGFSYAHRLDKGTSGVILFAKEQTALLSLEELFRKREITKEYLAWVKGSFPKETFIKEPIQCSRKMEGKIFCFVDQKGKEASTHFFLIKKTPLYSQVRALPHTGRTHQIRVHLQFLGYPICGDADYGDRTQFFSRLFLHAEKISFIHPYTEKKIEIYSPCPKEFEMI